MIELDLQEYQKIHSPNYVIEIFNHGKTTELLFGEQAHSNALFDIASLTKTFTAVLVYQAYEEGRLNLQSFVSDVDGNFRNLQDVRIIDLLAHRQNIWTDGYLGDATDVADFCHMLYGAFVKDSKPTYADAHYMILAKILEDVYRRNYATLVRTKIAEPLGLTSLTFMPKPEEVLPNHDYDESGCKSLVSSGLVHDHKARRAQELSIATGHAGIFINGPDMLKFLRAILENTLLSPETTQIMLQQTGEFYNNMGTRHNRTAATINDVPPSCSDKTISFSGYTGPMYVIDFERQNIVLIMCHVMYDTKLSRLERKHLTEQIMNEICSQL